MVAANRACVFLLVLFGVVSWPQATAQQPQGLDVTDDEDDVTVNGHRPPPEAFPHVDLRRVSLTDTEADIILEVEVGAFTRARPAHYTQSDDVRIDVHFVHAGEPFWFRLEVDAYANPTGQPPWSIESVWGEDLCLSGHDCQRLPDTLLDDAKNTFRVRAPKVLFTRFEVEVPKKGDLLTEIWATSQDKADYYVPDDQAARDRAPNEGTKGPYQLQHHTADQKVALTLVRPPNRWLPVAPGTNQSVEFNVTNLGLDKRIVRLAAIPDEADPRAQFFSVRTPSAVTVPGGQSRTVRFHVDVRPDAPYQARANVTLRGESVAFPDEIGLRPLPFYVSPVPTPQADTVYLHARKTGFSYSPAPDYRCHGLQPGCTDDYGSLRLDDPAAHDPDIFHDGAGSTWGGYGVGTDLGISDLGDHVAFDPSGTVTFALKASSSSAYPDADLNGFVRVNPQCPGCIPYMLAEASTTIDLDREPTTVQWSAPVKAKVKHLVMPGSSLTLVMRILLPQTAGQTEFGGVAFYGAGDTKIELPVVPVPLEITDVAPSAFQVTALDDPERFVNPGETQAYLLRILHGGAEAERARVSVHPTVPGWEVRIEPGTEFDLQPGDTIAVTVLVRAPANSTEGERITLHFAAKDEADREAVRVLRATVVNLEQPDQAQGYQLDLDAQERVVKTTPPKTPSTGALFVVVSLGLLALVRRRR